MKFIEYFERSRPTGAKLLLLGGEDTTLKNNIRLEFTKQNGLQKEYSQTGNVQDLIANMEEGGFFGPRLFDIFFTGKVKTPSLWNKFFEIASTSEHSMILCFEGAGGEWTDQTFKKHPGIFWFDCKFPKNKREKIRLITFLLGHRKINLENPDLITEISTRIKTSLDLENLLTCLRLLLEYSPKINMKDLRGLLREGDQETKSAHDLMGGNVSKLTEVIEISEPLELLAYWLKIIKSFYAWLSSDTIDTAAPAKDDDDDDDDDDKDSTKLNRYQLREYRIAKHRYSLRLVREVIEELNSVYQDCRVGRTDLWQERTKITIQKLAIRA